MNTKDLSQQLADGENWNGPLMEFVDDFRRLPSADMIAAPADTGSERLDALVAATVELLCDEAGLDVTARLRHGDGQARRSLGDAERLRDLRFAWNGLPWRPSPGLDHLREPVAHLQIARASSCALVLFGHGPTELRPTGRA